MSSSPPPPVGAQQSRFEQPRVIAPTLGGFWRSDVRRLPDRRAPRWAGWAAFALGILAVLTLFIGAVIGSALLVDISLAFSLMGGIFALVSLIAGIGRLWGLLGLVLSIAGNAFVIGWLGQLFT